MEYVNIGERFNMFLSVKFVESSESLGDLVRIYFDGTNRCLMLPQDYGAIIHEFDPQLGGLQPSAVVGWLLHSQGGSTTGQLSIWQSMAGRSGLAVWSGLILSISNHFYPKTGFANVN